MEIRPVEGCDAEVVSRIRRRDGVREGVLALTSERLEASQEFIASLGSGDRAFAALENGELAGMAVMLGNRTPKRRHCASVAVMVDTDFQGRGIGRELMSRLVDEADNVLNIRRLELLVLTDNVTAIKLYERFGFKIEAVRKHAAVKNGKFVDEYFMARINDKGGAA